MFPVSVFASTSVFTNRHEKPNINRSWYNEELEFGVQMTNYFVSSPTMTDSQPPHCRFCVYERDVGDLNQFYFRSASILAYVFNERSHIDSGCVRYLHRRVCEQIVRRNQQPIFSTGARASSKLLELVCQMMKKPITSRGPLLITNGHQK